jgi:3-dehydroquinate dehydratase type I
MAQADNPYRIKELIDASIPEGVEAIGMQFCKLREQYRNEKTYRELFAYTDLPVYVTNYRNHLSNAGKSDDVLAAELVELAECGATLCDVMGDYFDLCEGELTMDEEAVKKQMKLIDELHKRGAEVLMSSHVLKFTPAERVLEIALEHQRRGADICKIVTGADNMAQQIENLRIINLLKENLKIPFLFLSGGECHIMRRIGATLGSCMSLCVHEYDKHATKTQPLLCDMKKIRKLI